MKHTPGPWHIEADPASPNSVRVYPPADLPTGSRIPVADKVGKNDAALIAAAPALLDALRDLIAATPETYDNRHEIAAARDAIEKATGDA